MTWWLTCRLVTFVLTLYSQTEVMKKLMDVFFLFFFFFLFLPQSELHVSKLFHHPSILPYKSVFIAENELWVISPFMAYGEKWFPALAARSQTFSPPALPPPPPNHPLPPLSSIP